jgi:hypothetical protein
MAESVLALTPINSQGGAILTFAFPMLLFLVIAAILWAFFAGWDWPISRRFRPASVRHFQTAIAEAGPDTAPAPAPVAAAGSAPDATASQGTTAGAPGAPGAPAGGAPPAPGGDAAQAQPGEQGAGQQGSA